MLFSQALAVLSATLFIEQIQGEDFSFLQDASFRSVYEDYSGDALISDVWEKLPFQLDVTSSKNSLATSTSCALVVTNGKFYGASLKFPTPSITDLSNPYNAWEEIGDTQLEDLNTLIIPNKADPLLVYGITSNNVIQITFTPSKTGGCGDSIVETKKLILSQFEVHSWGTVQSTSFSMKMEVLFIGTEDGVRTVSLNKGEN